MIDNLYSSALFLVVSNQFLTLSDLSKDTLDEVLDVSLELKKNPQNNAPLKNKFLGLIFEKPSTRTRVSFEVAMARVRHAIHTWLYSLACLLARAYSFSRTMN